METFIQEPLWTEPVVKSRWDLMREANEIHNPDGTVTCRHCGETEANDCIFDINHSAVFNGWCSKRLFLNQRAPIGSVPEDMEWLNEHGWGVVDAHDKANWA